ncbi:MAG TPA: PilN domain-containing protein [Terriglobales bacterium]|nr:PilN domain-containing protein [Terriglobales bacterium]
MFADRYAFASLKKLAPVARTPRLARTTRHSGWSVRRAALGLEVRGASLFLACVRPGYKRRWLTSTGVIHDFAQLSAEQLRQRIADVLGSSAAEEPAVVLGLPRREVIVRHLQLPAAAQKSLDSVLDLQLGLYKPSDDEEFCWDAAVGAPSGANDAQLAVSLAFAPRTRVQELAALLREAGYAPARLTTAQFSTLDWVLRGRDLKTSPRLIVLQARGAEVELAVVEDGRCLLSRSFVAANADAVAAQVQQSLATLRTTRAEPFTILVAGPGSEDWREPLASLGTVERLSYFCQAEEVSETVEARDSGSEEFWGAIALALDGLSWAGDYRLNLLPRELRAARRRWRNAPLIALLVLDALLLGALVARKPVQQRLLLRRYGHEIEQVQRSAEKIALQKAKSEKIEQRLATLRDFQQKGRRPLDALSDVAQKLPPDAWVSNFTCHQGTVELVGIAKSASVLLPALKASNELDDVQFAGALTRDPAGERFRMQMKLRASR